MDGQARPPHIPSSQRTAGDWYSPEDGSTVWSANGEVLIASCNSRHLCPAGNAANARYIAKAPARDAAARELIAAGEAVLNAKSQTPDEVAAMVRLLNALTAAKAVHP